MYVTWQQGQRSGGINTIWYKHNLRLFLMIGEELTAQDII